MRRMSARLGQGSLQDDSDDERATPREQDGIVGNLQEQIRTQYDKGMLELRLQLVRMRTEYLNNINTQSTLLAACSVAMLGSSELQAFTEVGNRRRPVDEYDRIEMDLWSWIFAVQYVVSGATCLSASVWVIYTAMNLINLSIHSTLYGKSMAELAEADNIIELRMAEVRLAFIISLASLFSATFAMLAEEAPTVLMIIGGACFAAVAWHASTSDAGTVDMYERYTGLKVKDRWQGMESLTELITPFGFANHRGAQRYSALREAAAVGVNALTGGKIANRKGKFGLQAKGGGGGGGTAEDGAPSDAMEFLSPRSVEALKVKSAVALERAYRRYKARQLIRDAAAGADQLPTRGAASGLHVCAGWLLKTGSGNGPVDRQREALKAASSLSGTSKTSASVVTFSGGSPSLGPQPGGRPPITSIADVPPGDPTFPKYFLLHEKKRTLSIYGSDEEFLDGHPPKFVVDSISTYALLRLVGRDGRSTLALLPNIVMKQPELIDQMHAQSDLAASDPLSPRAAQMRSKQQHANGNGAVGGSGASLEGHGGLLNKGWYLRGADESDTSTWYGRLRAAGAVWKGYDYKRSRSPTRQPSFAAPPPPAQLPRSAAAATGGGGGGGGGGGSVKGGLLIGGGVGASPGKPPLPQQQGKPPLPQQQKVGGRAGIVERRGYGGGGGGEASRAPVPSPAAVAGGGGVGGAPSGLDSAAAVRARFGWSGNNKPSPSMV